MQLHLSCRRSKTTTKVDNIKKGIHIEKIKTNHSITTISITSILGDAVEPYNMPVITNIQRSAAVAETEQGQQRIELCGKPKPALEFLLV